MGPRLVMAYRFRTVLEESEWELLETRMKKTRANSTPERVDQERTLFKVFANNGSQLHSDSTHNHKS